MKKNIQLLFAIVLTSFSLVAQDTSICDGDRLVEPIFSDIQVTDGVVYGVGVDVLGRDVDLLMDVYEPIGDDVEQRPVVILAHGGSFIAGTRKNDVMVATCSALAERGYVAASIEYTLWPFVPLGVPDSTDLIGVVVAALGDMRTAIRYFNEDGLTDNEFRVNPDLISVGGYSAGSIIACHHGMLDETDEVPEFLAETLDDRGGISALGSNFEYSDDAISILNLSGSIYLTDFIDENSLPIFSSHGDADGTVPYMFGLTGGVLNSHGSFNIAQRYDELGLENELFTFDGGGHTDIFSDAVFADRLEEMYDNLFAWNREQVCGLLSTSSEDLFTTSARVYPNPAQNEINIELPNDLDSKFQIEIFNQIGQQVYHGSSMNNIKETIRLDNLENGLYVIQINFEEKYAPLAQRIVIAK